MEWLLIIYFSWGSGFPGTVNVQVFDNQKDCLAVMDIEMARAEIRYKADAKVVCMTTEQLFGK